MRAAVESHAAAGGRSAASAASAARSRSRPGYREPVLVASTDGVGTKTAIAAALGRYDTIGIDLVAMCADDVVCSGAEPLFFLDYIAVGRLDPPQASRSSSAASPPAAARRAARSSAARPRSTRGSWSPTAFDLAGCCVGVVERDRLIDGSAARAGDAIVGLASSGLHANGFSLVRSAPRPVGPRPRPAVPGAARC